MKLNKQAKRYAKTFLNIVGIEDAPEALDELGTINDLMTRSKEFKSLLVSPQFTSEEREAVLKQIAGKTKLSNSTVKFIMHLSELRVIIALSEIIKIATNLYLEKKKKAKAVVMTPIEISKDYEKRLKISLRDLTDRDVDIEFVMDPSLLGGVLVKVGSTMYDSSIKGQLRLLKDELIKG